MEGIKLFLDKFKNLAPEDEALKVLLLAIIKKEAGVSLDKKALSISKWTVYIKAPSAAKSEIYIKREQIMSALEAELGRQGLKQIV